MRFRILAALLLSPIVGTSTAGTQSLAPLPGMPSLEVVKHCQLCLLRKINLGERCRV